MELDHVPELAVLPIAAIVTDVVDCHDIVSAEQSQALSPWCSPKISLPHTEYHGYPPEEPVPGF